MPNKYKLGASKYMSEYLRVRPEKRLLFNARSRSAKKGYECSIDESDILVPEYCPICDIKLDLYREHGITDALPTLDRVDNSKGYVKGNVRVISWRANQLKRDITVEEAKRLYEYIVSTET